MSVLGVLNPTLLDLARRQDPDGSIAKIVELLQQRHGILTDMMWREGNMTTGHKSTVRTGLPSGTWRKLYGFVQPGKSTTAQVIDTTGWLEAYSEIDKALADLEDNKAEFRLSEDMAFIQGLNNQMESALFYSNEKENAEQITGLTPRFNSLSALNAENIVVGGGTSTDNGSIWLCVWGPMSGFGIIPKGSRAGLVSRDLGEVTKESTSGLMQVYRTHYRWDAGLCVKDWRYFVRIPNIDKSDLSVVYTAGAFASGAHLPNLMFKAMNRIPSLSDGRPVFYMSRDMLTTLQQQLAAAVQSSSLTTEMVGGVLQYAYKGLPIRVSDALAADEAKVT